MFTGNPPFLNSIFAGNPLDLCRKKASAGIQHPAGRGPWHPIFHPQLSAHCFGGTTAKKSSTDDIMARSGLLTTVVPRGSEAGGLPTPPGQHVTSNIFSTWVRLKQGCTFQIAYLNR